MKNIHGGRNVRNAIRIAATLILLLTAFGCRKKSDREIAEDNAIKRHQRQAQAVKNFRVSPGLKQAANFLAALRMQGKLPGVSTNDHGSWRVEKRPNTLPDGRLTQEFHIIITTISPPQNYYYVITENTNSGESQLTRAWRADASGKVIEQYPVQ